MTAALQWERLVVRKDFERAEDAETQACGSMWRRRVRRACDRRAISCSSEGSLLRPLAGASMMQLRRGIDGLEPGQCGGAFVGRGVEEHDVGSSRGRQGEGVAPAGERVHDRDRVGLRERSRQGLAIEANARDEEDPDHAPQPTAETSRFATGISLGRDDPSSLASV